MDGWWMYSTVCVLTESRKGDTTMETSIINLFLKARSICPSSYFVLHLNPFGKYAPQSSASVSAFRVETNEWQRSQGRVWNDPLRCCGLSGSQSVGAGWRKCTGVGESRCNRCWVWEQEEALLRLLKVLWTWFNKTDPLHAEDVAFPTRNRLLVIPKRN